MEGTKIFQGKSFCKGSNESLNFNRFISCEDNVINIDEHEDGHIVSFKGKEGMTRVATIEFKFYE